MKLIAITVCLLGVLNVYAQNNADSDSIKKICADYVEGFYTQDADRMKNALHPDLVKRIIDNRTGTSVIQNTTRDELASYLKPEYKMKDANPNEAFKTNVTIFDIESDIAIAKITTNKMNFFFDYVQLAKFNDKWQIINVLWAYHKK